MKTTEAANKTVFQNIYIPVFFFSGATFLQFSRRVYRTDMFFHRGSICLSNRPLSHRTDTKFSHKPLTIIISSNTYIQIFQEPLSSHRTDINFPGASNFSSYKYSFFRKPYLASSNQILN